MPGRRFLVESMPRFQATEKRPFAHYTEQSPTRLSKLRDCCSYVHQPVTDKTDVYSMGMIFYSLINGDTPYETPESFKLALVNKSRPEIDPSWHEGFMEVSPAEIFANNDN